ncbi:disulfide bond formation protein B [Legionella maioricensis]|uniref:Disulfide bond formation protein B n=1 Tax=Legionella maioricensis TaxID=2896528 RepID=A0A9X2CZD3_9GAMM|nr:disulfide bond formation protein B [Legionella maioricensis]MCL9683280.1 disulfide bond formation protein B [Legionella maioricensis]MCL9686023.1 disulfide bond formation protein B [Legionella maioricensis]
MNKQGKLHLLGNLLGLLIICSILIFALWDQLIIDDLPCPLCLLQRVCYIAIGLGMLMNLRLGVKPSHYGLMSLATLLGLAISVRQITLHLAPGDMGYGSPILGYYLYTWAAISFAVIITLIALALIFDQGFNIEYKIQHPGGKALIALFLFLILANVVSTFILCGPFTCPDNPTQYYF